MNYKTQGLGTSATDDLRRKLKSISSDDISTDSELRFVVDKEGSIDVILWINITMNNTKQKTSIRCIVMFESIKLIDLSNMDGVISDEATRMIQRESEFKHLIKPPLFSHNTKGYQELVNAIQNAQA